VRFSMCQLTNAVLEPSPEAELYPELITRGHARARTDGGTPPPELVEHPDLRRRVAVGR
jgi:hypothetical protein